MKIHPDSRPVKQRLRRFDEEKRRAIGEEIAKLLVAGFIKEVYHPKWLANPVLVRKKRREMEDVCSLYGSQQSRPNRSVSFALPRLDS